MVNEGPLAPLPSLLTLSLILPKSTVKELISQNCGNRHQGEYLISPRGTNITVPE